MVAAAVSWPVVGRRSEEEEDEEEEEERLTRQVRRPRGDRKEGNRDRRRLEETLLPEQLVGLLGVDVAFGILVLLLVLRLPLRRLLVLLQLLPHCCRLIDGYHHQDRTKDNKEEHEQ